MDFLHKEKGLSLRRAFELLRLSPSVYYYRPKEPDDGPVMDALEEMATEHPTYGFWKIYPILRERGHQWNHKRVHRVYVTMRMNKRRKHKRRLPERVKEPLCLPVEPNVTWSMDFQEDTLMTGKRFRTLNVIDDHNREALMIHPDTSLPGQRIVRELDELISWRGKPERLRVDNGPEFLSLVFKQWAENNGIEIIYIQPGKPTQNSLIERFNRSFRQEVLGAYLFTDLEQVKERINGWIWEYNNKRPHDALGSKSPRAFIEDRGKGTFPTVQKDEHQNRSKTLTLSVTN